jgi:hypothetical protein
VNNDQTTRSAGLLAAAIAVPVALIAGFVAFQALKPSTPTVTPPPSASPRVISSAPVSVAAAQLDEHQATACRALITGMPAQARDLPRRPVTGATDQAAAYGDVLIRCGGLQPSFAPTDLVYPISGVCWVPNTDGSRWTTVDREIPVAIELSGADAGPGSGQWAAAFSELGGKSVPPLTTKPSGCP